MKGSIILVSPNGAFNVGGVARVMKNFGFRDLRIVDPRFDLQDLDCKKGAMTAYEIILSAKIFPTLKEAQADLQFTFGFSGREVYDFRPHENIFDLAKTYNERFSEEEKVGFVFGREETGLHLDELELCNLQIYIPTLPDFPSMNLTSAVALSLGTLNHFAGEAPPFVLKRHEGRPFKHQEEYFFEKAYGLLGDIKFLSKQNSAHLSDDLRAMFHRAVIDRRDLRILFAILARMEYQMERASKGEAKDSEILMESSL